MWKLILLTLLALFVSAPAAAAAGSLDLTSSIVGIAAIIIGWTYAANAGGVFSPFRDITTLTW